MISAETIREYVQTLGADIIGIIDSSPLHEVKEVVGTRIREGYATPFESSCLVERITPRYHMPECRSIIVLALPYRAACRQESRRESREPRGKVARCARVTDYHAVMQDISYRLVKFIKDNTGKSFSYRVAVDKTPLVERALARKAGGALGFNGAFIHPLFGSWVSLGEILLDIPMPGAASHHPGLCTACGKCLQACPTGAITSGGLNPWKCISFITQNRSFIEPAYRRKIGLNVYGCDTCQEVCPQNQNVPPSPLKEFSRSLLPARPELIYLLRMGQKEFSRTAGATSAGWVGKRILARNAVICLGNSRDDMAVEPLRELLYEHPRADMRAYAAWALGQIGGSLARKTLLLSFSKENNQKTAEEIEAALDNC